MAPGTEDPTHLGCHLREAACTFPALAGDEYPTGLGGLTRGAAAQPDRRRGLQTKIQPTTERLAKPLSERVWEPKRRRRRLARRNAAVLDLFSRMSQPCAAGNAEADAGLCGGKRGARQRIPLAPGTRSAALAVAPRPTRGEGAGARHVTATGLPLTSVPPVTEKSRCQPPNSPHLPLVPYLTTLRVA